MNPCVGLLINRVSDTDHSRRRSDLKYLELKIRWFSRRYFAVTGTPFTHVKTCLKFWGCYENVFDMYGDSCENWFEILAVVMILSPISCACGLLCLGCAYKWHVLLANQPFTNSCVRLRIINVADTQFSCLSCSYKWHVSVTNQPFTNSCVRLRIINVADTHFSCLSCSYKWHVSVTNQPFMNPCVRLPINYVWDTGSPCLDCGLDCACKWRVSVTN